MEEILIGPWVLELKNIIVSHRTALEAIAVYVAAEKTVTDDVKINDIKKLVSRAVKKVDQEEGIDTDVDKSALLADRDAADAASRRQRRRRM